MSNVFLVLMLLSIVAFIVGLARPRTLFMRTRKLTSLTYGVSIVLFFVLFGVTAPSAPATTPPPSNSNGASTATMQGKANQIATSENSSSQSPITKVVNNSNTTTTKTIVSTNTTAKQPATTNTSKSASTTSSSVGLIPVVVSKETDGDTIHVTMPNGKDQTVRMLLIDTPEDVKPGTPVEPFSLAAAHYCAQVMPVGKHIYLQEGVKGHQYGKYGRLLAFVYITPKDMYNEDVVKKGLARVAYIYPPNTQHLSALEADQSYAKAHHLGIWTIPGYVTSHGYNLAVVKSTKKTTTKTGPKPKSTTKTTTSILSLVSFTSDVTPGSYATITVHGKPGTTADIEVDYKSGPSHAHGLVPETVNSNGNVSWEWKIGTRTTPGNWPVTITDGGKTLTETLHVQ